MIDDKKLIESLRASLNTGKECFPIDLIIECIEEQPKVGEWIACSEQIPPKPEEYNMFEKGYIVQDKYVLEPYTAFWDGEKWTNILDDVLKDIIAWQPLPEPYKPGKE